MQNSGQLSFNWLESLTAEQFSMSKNQYQSFHSGQSQSTETIQWSNQNSYQIHAAAAKRGKRVRTGHVRFGFTSDWMKTWREF